MTTTNKTTKKEIKNDTINNRFNCNNYSSSSISKLWNNNITLTNNKQERGTVMKQITLSSNQQAIQDIIDNLKDTLNDIEEYELMVDDCNKDVANGHKYQQWVLDTLKLATQKSQGRGDYTQNKCKTMKERFITMIEDLESFRKHYLTWDDKLVPPLEKLYYELCEEKEYRKGDR